VGSPACADDVALLAGSHQELQTQLLVTENFASKGRYKINPTKSNLLIFNSRHTTDQWNDSIRTSIFSQPIKVVENTVHLGVHRYARPHDQSSDAIRKGRDTCYSLMGSGLHGVNGVKPTVSLHIWDTFVKPRMLFGLETISLSAQDHKKFSSYQIKLLKQLRSSLYLIERQTWQHMLF
jgi:hypothetical protein